VRDAVLALLMMLYPLGIFLARGHLSPRWLGLGLAVLAVARLSTARQKSWLWAGAAALMLAVAAAFLDSAWPLKAYPVAVNLTMLLLFGASLLHPPTVIERLARLREPELPPSAVAYTRKVTWVWCVFFVLNGLCALALGLWASDAAWAMFTGGVSYILMGLLFAGEWLVRKRVKVRHAHD
jgi:uncharacterized membrane protein